MVRVAFARHADAAQAVDQCRRSLAGATPRLLLVFCGGKHDPHAVLGALRQSFGEDVPVVGGSAAGAIAREGFGYSGLEIGIAAITSPEVQPRIIVQPGLDHGEEAAGECLGRRIAQACEHGAVVLFLYDSVAEMRPLRLHPGSALTAGLQRGLDGHAATLIGGGMLTDLNLSDSWIFDGTGTARHAVVALAFPSAVRAQTVILHGCRPASSFMEITRIAGAEVFELDGEPALPVIERMLGIPLQGSRTEELSLLATLGEKQGDPFAPYDENAYVNRLILRVDRTSGSVTLFEPDFQTGTRVQIMSRDNGLMLDSVRQGVGAMNERLAGADNLLALYIDCAGRVSARSGAPQEEAELVGQGLAPGVPLLGFYSGVEIAPFGGYSRPLDWTGVLTVLQRA
jgi:hypothetical protein